MTNNIEKFPKYKSVRISVLSKEQKRLARRLRYSEDKFKDFLEKTIIQRRIDYLNKLLNESLEIKLANHTDIQELKDTIEQYKKRYSALCNLQ